MPRAAPSSQGFASSVPLYSSSVHLSPSPYCCTSIYLYMHIYECSAPRMHRTHTTTAVVFLLASCFRFHIVLFFRPPTPPRCCCKVFFAACAAAAVAAAVIFSHMFCLQQRQPFFILKMYSNFLGKINVFLVLRRTRNEETTVSLTFTGFTCCVLQPHPTPPPQPYVPLLWYTTVGEGEEPTL